MSSIAAVFERLKVWWQGYWFEPMPVARLDVFAGIVFVTVAFSLIFPDHWVADHAIVPESFYQPVSLARLVHLPAPTETTMTWLRWLTVAACGVALPRRAPRITSGIVFVGSTVWLLWAFSYGKVDHDRLTITVALLALTLTPRRGPAVEAATGWALRLVQVVFALAYPFSAIVKLRTAGFEWANSAVFTRAIVRRGTELGDWLVRSPWLLRTGQWAFLAFELFGVVLLCRNTKLRAVALTGVVLLHAFTYATIGISFLPHTICITAFLPLERLTRTYWSRSYRSNTRAALSRKNLGQTSSLSGTSGSSEKIRDKLKPIGK